MACGVLSLHYLSPLLRRSAAAPALPGTATERRWGVVQPVGHLTVNEDGEGSNPSAPARFPNEIAAKPASDGLNTTINTDSFAQKANVPQRRSI